MATALFSHESSLRHVTPQGHPEQVARIEHIMGVLTAPQFAALDRREAPECSDDDILLCHPQAHLDAIAAAVGCFARRFLEEQTSLGMRQKNPPTSGFASEGREIKIGIKPQKRQLKTVLAAGLPVTRPGIASVSRENRLNVPFKIDRFGTSDFREENTHQ